MCAALDLDLAVRSMSSGLDIRFMAFSHSPMLQLTTFQPLRFGVLSVLLLSEAQRRKPHGLDDARFG